MRTAARCICSALLAMPAAAQIPPMLSALCPKARPGEIVVCADIEPPKSPYRLPLPAEPVQGDRDTISVSRERNALIEDGADGILSCSASGAAGAAGCGFQRHRRWVEQRATAHDPRGPIFDKPRD